jgi:predicted AAA+ superfamily ATPase
VPSILEAAGVKTAPQAAIAVFVGTEFDAISGRGGKNGEPIRHTPWGEIAFQLNGTEGFATVAKHDEQRTAPSAEVIRQFLPKDRPVLILLDELLNFMGRNRKSGLTAQLYAFVQNLSEEARAQDRVVLAVSLPSLLDEMTPDDEADFDRFQKLLDRLGKAMIMSAEAETSEIIRRRLFEWGGLPDEGRKTAGEYAEWVQAHRTQVPQWFPADHAKEALAATYPFHPTLLSVFERKWQVLPRFQQTRGILRLLALWVSHAYQAGFKGAHKDPLIGMGTAPLDEPMFRAAIFEQLGGAQLEGAVTTDICGTKGSHSVRLDKEAVETIRKARLHQKVSTVIFFESNGGQTKTEATLPEIRLAVAEPDLDIGNIETALEALTDTSYYLSADKNRYRFSLSPNLNKLLSDRRAGIQPTRVEERIRAEVQKVFKEGNGLDRTFFPEKSSQVSDRPVLTLVILPPDRAISEQTTRTFIDTATREHGTSS